MPDIILSYPPNIEAIRKVFPAVEKTHGVIFSWGDKIYNPDNIPISTALYAHEAVHGSRQTADESAILKWWSTYLDDLDFRVKEEVLGHRAELKVQLQNVADRNKRNMLVQQVALRLSGPIYGNALSLAAARSLLAHL